MKCHKVVSVGFVWGNLQQPLHCTLVFFYSNSKMNILAKSYFLELAYFNSKVSEHKTVPNILDLPHLKINN